MNQENGVGRAVVYVKLKDGVLDPQGSTIKRALEDMGYQGI
ncbi:MAG TPA: phosphoribosylformylglycinamidine synthase subunit PurS, partial [candidate division Zixibacteria bacterium]